MAKKPESTWLKTMSALVRAGRLFQLQADLKTTDATSASGEEWSELLRVAVKSGFHDMAQVVVDGRKWTPDELERPLDHALWDRRLDVAELLIEKGAPLNRMEMHDICHTMDVELIRSYLRRGADPAYQKGFARALNSSKAKPLLGIYRSLREEFPVLDDQAALALSEAVNDKNARWVSLLRWAGADPWKLVPWGLDGKWDDQESLTSAAIQACWGDREDIFRMLKLQPTPEQAADLLYHSIHQPTLSITKYLLGFVSRERINDTDRGSSKALELVVREEHREYGFERRPRQEREEQTLQCVELLLDHGAKWNPDDDHLRWTRRGLGTHDGKYTVRMIRLLLYTAGASDPARIWELCRTDTMKSRIRMADAALWKELLVLKPQ